MTPSYPDIRAFLTPRQQAAAREVVRRVRAEVDAELWRVFLFGSRARREARPDSDVDLLLVFRRLPPDREPQAAEAEEIADEVAERSGVPVTVWSVSLPDLERGRRTPMLVDALDDGIPLWPEGGAPLHLPFTADDAAWCSACLLDRVAEGGAEAPALLRAGDVEGAARRVRDDVVRLCTALLLAHGETRPRRGDAVRRVQSRDPVLGWAAGAFGPRGTRRTRPCRRRRGDSARRSRRWRGCEGRCSAAGSGSPGGREACGTVRCITRRTGPPAQHPGRADGTSINPSATMKLIQTDGRQRRTLSAVFTVTFVLSILLTAFFQTQVVSGKQFAIRAEENRLRPIVIPAPRGTIVDRNGEVVATSLTAYSVAVLPGDSGVIRTTLRDLMPFLGLAEADVEEMMRKRNGRPHDLLEITNRATYSQAAAIEERRAAFPNLLVVERPQRYYPAGPAIGHMIGYVTEITKEQLELPEYKEAGYRQGRLIGQAGMEKQYELQLTGEDGARYVEVDAKGRVVNPTSSVGALAPKPGGQLKLTIDLALQRYVHEIFPTR
jgi:predicted nucleotidyltransferase